MLTGGWRSIAPFKLAVQILFPRLHYQTAIRAIILFIFLDPPNQYQALFASLLAVLHFEDPAK